ncbi:MAG: peptidylprolyl isomerase, partial [Tepidisphaeraceae bacterium]
AGLPPVEGFDKKPRVATIKLTTGTVTVALAGDKAPCTVASFEHLASKKFFDGSKCHRLTTGGIFVLQCGDPTGTGGGGPGYKLKQEFNDTKHVRGVLSMARTNDPDSAGSQFFVMHAAAPFLDNQYTVFGKLTKGDEVIDKIVNAPRNAQDRPNEPTKIKTIKIEEK